MKSISQHRSEKPQGVIWVWLKLNRGGCAGVGHCFHLPGIHFGTSSLSHSHITPKVNTSKPSNVPIPRLDLGATKESNPRESAITPKRKLTCPKDPEIKGANPKVKINLLVSIPGLHFGAMRPGAMRREPGSPAPPGPSGPLAPP